jgi:hypothetical protein
VRITGTDCGRGTWRWLGTGRVRVTGEPGGMSPLGKHWAENIDTEVESNGI